VVSIVLDTSRVHNAVIACGMMRRAYLEAQSFAIHRKAFGRPIIEYPLIRKTLEKMRVLGLASLATTFRILHMSDKIALNEAPEYWADARRICVNINKYWTSLKCTEVARCGIEVLGGNGTIEDFSVLPRLYRDAIVVESWEGTHNTLCMQVLRDFAQRNMHRGWFAWIHEMIAALENSAQREGAVKLAEEIHSEVERMLDSLEEDASAQIRMVVDRMCILQSYLCLLL
jgi:alkylation response protein AidB-like acyl-CoA dehydrogenase